MSSFGQIWQEKQFVKEMNWKKMLPTVIVFAVLIMLTVERIHYTLIATANVPVMDYWRYIVQFVDKLMEGNVTIMDLWEPYSSHRSGISTFLFLINVKWFGLNTQIEILLGAIGTFINCIFLFWIFLKKNQWNTSWVKCGFILVALCMFNINQWEIVTLEFSLGFSLRILLVLWTFYLFDTLQIRERKKWIIASFSVSMLVVAYLTGSYGPAVLGTFVFISIIYMIVGKESKWKKCIQNLIIIFFLGAGLIIFFWGLESNSGSGATKSFFDILLDGTLIKGIFLMLGSSVVHIESNVVSQHPNILLYIGVILFLVYVLAIVLFFRLQIYKKTYMPLMLMAYTACIILVIVYGRSTMFGVEYVRSSRYVCETTLGLAGICWIFLYQIQYMMDHRKEKNYLSMVKTVACICGLVLIMGSIGYSYKVEKGIAPFRKVYQENLIELMKSGEELTDEQCANFQADTHLVNQGIAIMRKYNLGVFREKE